MRGRSTTPRTAASADAGPTLPGEPDMFTKPQQDEPKRSPLMDPAANEPATPARPPRAASRRSEDFFPPKVEVRRPETPRPEGVEPFNKPGAEAVLGAGFDRIVERVYAIDSEAEYNDLESALTLGMRASAADYGTIVNALDLANDYARRAMRLFVNAKVAHAAFDLDAQAIVGALRREVSEQLEAEKRADYEAAKALMGSKAPSGKQITESDVLARVAASYPDQYRDIEIRREKSKQMVAMLERLAELWKQRARDLQVMASNARA